MIGVLGLDALGHRQLSGKRLSRESMHSKVACVYGMLHHQFSVRENTAKSVFYGAAGED